MKDLRSPFQFSTDAKCAFEGCEGTSKVQSRFNGNNLKFDVGEGSIIEEDIKQRNEDSLWVVLVLWCKKRDIEHLESVKGLVCGCDDCGKVRDEFMCGDVWARNSG